MKIIISPAKLLNYKEKAPTTLHTLPRFLNFSTKLNNELKKISEKSLSSLMNISPSLAYLNYQRNQSWSSDFSIDTSKQAVYVFNGDVYKGLDPYSIEDKKIPILQEKLRILSGLYGILKPLDLILPYRLEMGTKLKVETNDNLYKFWGNKLANSLNNEMDDSELFLNLASNEYSKVIPSSSLKVPIITPIFKELRIDKYKTIAIYAKKARGLMVRYIIDNNINTIDGIKCFNKNGYGFSDELSNKTQLVFTR